MRKFTIFIFTMGLLTFLYENLSFAQRKKEVSSSIYDFKILSLEGNEINFSQFRGKNLLIVNTASKCAYTPQYAELEKLHEQYGDKVVVLGFPANNFLWQEPGSNNEIGEFCQRNYGVKFLMFEKISVKGRSQHPLYKWLAAKSGHTPTWNFCKYFVDQEGKVVEFYSSKVSPLSPEIINQISN